MANWLDSSNNANTFASSYLEGFVDISGSIISRNSNDLIINVGDVSLCKELIVSGDTSFNQNLFINKDVSLNSNLYIGGDISWNSTNIPNNSIPASALQNIQSVVSDNLLPDSNVTYDLGTNTYRFRDLYLSSKTLNIGNAAISSTDNNAVNLPPNTVINNEAIKGIEFAGTIENELALTNLNNINPGFAYINTSTNEVHLSTGINEWLKLGVISGSTGTTGTIGEKGEKGLVGDDGSKGNVIGPTGEVGEKGSPFTGNGITGPKGNIGVNGYTGPTNDKGVLGEEGSNGLIGQLGQKGVQGFKGTNGEQGKKGIIGDIGFQDLIGQQGNFGDIGSQGVKGINGKQGIKGSRGENGQEGIIGDIGFQGSNGQKGNIGEIGSQGLKGVIGVLGQTGPIDLISNVTMSKNLLVENDVTLNKDVDINGQTYVYSFVNDATPYGGSTNISSVMGDFPTLRSNHSVSNANLWRATYTKTVDSYTGNNSWKNGDYTVTCSDFKQYYGAYSNPENAFSSLVIDNMYAWNSGSGNIPINYVDSNGNTQTLSDSTMNQWIALELPIHVKVTNWTCYCTGYAGRNWHLLGRDRMTGLIRDLHIGTQNYGLIDGNPSYKEQYITNNVTTDIFVDKLYFVFNGNLNNNSSASIGNINFTGEMMPNSKSGLIVDGNASFTGTIDIGSFGLSANSISINQNDLSLDNVTVTSNIDGNTLVTTNNATNLLNMDVSENLTFDDNCDFVVQSGVETHMNNDLYVNKNTSLDNDLYVKGNIVSDGSINLSKYNNDYVIESNTTNYQVNTIETFEVKKNTNIENDTIISQNIFVDEDVSMNNGLFVKEDVIWDPTKLAANSIYNASLIGGGITGPTGIQGIKGDIGQKGDIGFQKLETVTGYRGSIGPKGVIGIKGEKHLTNNVGSQGDTGYPDPHENLTLDGVFRIDGTLAIQNDLSWTPATTIAPNIIHPHCLSGYQSDMPDHTIALWSGSISNIPNGWAICDGTNNTPDLRSKFVIGHDSRDLSFNIDMSGASYLLDPVGTNSSERNAFFIGDISDNGSWVDANGNKNATDAYNDNIYYTLAYIIKNIGATDVSNSFTFENYAKFEGDLSFNYDTPNGIDLRSIITTIDINQTLENVTFNKDISINNTLANNLYISADTINVNDTSLNVFTEKTNPINNIIVENKMKVGGNVNIPPDDTTTVRSMNNKDSLQLSQNIFKSNRNEIDGNLLVNNTIKTKNKQEGVNLVDPLLANQNTQFKETNNSGKTFGRFNTLAMNGEGNIIVYGEKEINTLEYPKNKGKIIVRKQLPNGNWISYGNAISTQFCSVDINDEGNILAIGNKYAEDTSILKEQVPYYNDGTNNTIKGSSILADITGDNIGRYVFNRQYTNYKIYQDGEVKIYIYNDSTNIWEPMNMGYTRYHSADGTKITKGQYYGQLRFNVAEVGTIDPNYYTSLATSSSIVPFEPFQAFGNLVKLNKAGNRILIAPEGHGGYNVGKSGRTYFNGKSQTTDYYALFRDNGFYGASTAETLYRVAHVYEYDIINKLWKQLGSPIVVWDGNCCGYNEWASSPYFYWEARHSSAALEREITYYVDHTLRSYDNHKANADSLGMRLASVIDENTLNNIKTYSGNDELFLGNSYNFSNGTWEANEVQYPSNSDTIVRDDYATFNNEMNQTVFYNGSNWENSILGSGYGGGIMDLSFNKHLPTSNTAAVIHNISGTKLLSTVSRNAKKYAIYELYREYRENHVTTANNPSFGVPNGTYIEPGDDIPFVYYTSTGSISESADDHFVVEYDKTEVYDPNGKLILNQFINERYRINGDDSPIITLVRGESYTFDLSYFDLLNNPFEIVSPQGVTYSGTQGTPGASATFVVPNNAPDRIEYAKRNLVVENFVVDYYIQAPEEGHYKINGVVDPTFSLIRGNTYTFNLSATNLQSLSGEFLIKRSNGSIYLDGITYFGTQGNEGANLTFTVPQDAPDTLEYENATSSLHAPDGRINIIDPTPVGSFKIISNIQEPENTFIRRYTITSERHYFFVEILKTFDEHKEDASIIYSPTDSDAYNHPHLTNAFGVISDDPRGKPFRALQSLASIVDDTSFTEIKNALGNNSNESAFINCEYVLLNGSGWQINLDTYPKYHLDNGRSVADYQRRSRQSRINRSHDTTDFIIPKNDANLYYLYRNVYSFNSNIIHDKWHHAEPKNIHDFNAAPAHVVNIYKDRVDGRIKVSGYAIGSTIENIPLQYGNVGNQSYDEQSDFYRIPRRFIAGETYLFIYNTHDTAIQLYESSYGSSMGSEIVALGTSGTYLWTVPTTYEDSTSVGLNSWGTAAEGYHYYIGASRHSNHIKMRVTSSYSNTTTPKYRLTIKNNKLLLYNQNIHHHEGKAIYEKVHYPGTNKIVPKSPEGTQFYPGGREYGGSNSMPERIDDTIGDGNLMFSGVEKLYVKIDSISFNDEGTIAAFGLTGVGQQDIFRRGMYRGAALVYRLKNKNVADTSFNFISRPVNDLYLRRGELCPFHNPEELLSCWERIGVFNGANNVAEHTQTSVGFKYIGHFGSAVCLNGVGNILAISARDSTYYNNTTERPGWITTIGTNTKLTDENFSETGTVSYSTATSDGTTDRSAWNVNNGLGGVSETVRGGYVQVFQYASDSGDIITESNNPGSNDRWQQLGGTIIPQVANERCGSGLAINKEGNILSVGGLVGYIEGPLSGDANHATHHTRYRPGIIRNFIFRHLTYDEANEMHLIVGRSESGKAHLGDSDNAYSTLFNLNINQKHWIQIGRDTLDFLQYAGQYNDDNDIKVLNYRDGNAHTFVQGEKYRSKIANILYPLDYHHYRLADRTIVESGNYHTTTISDGNYDYDDETMNKIHNYYGKWSVDDCNVVMNRSGTRFMTNTFIERNNAYIYRDPSVRIIDINSTHFQNTTVSTNQNNSRLVINKDISTPSFSDANNDIEYTILDISGNAEINQNISTKHYKSIRSITVDIGTNSSSSKTVSFSYGKTYSDLSKLAFNVNVYSAGTNDNKQIDATIYNYTTTGAKLLVEASSAESDKTWSYSLKATVVIFETTDFTPVTPVYDYGTVYRYPPAAVPVAGDNGTSSFRGELQNQSYGNGIYRIYTRNSDFSWIDVTGSYYENRVKHLIDFDLVYGGRFTADTDVYFYYEFPDQIYIREIEIFYNTSSNCQVDVWKNETTFNVNHHTHSFNTNWNNIYDGAIDYKDNKSDPAIVTMDDHNYKSTNIRIRLYGGTEYIHPRLILFNVTF